MTSRLAPSAAARCAASVSALTFSSCAVARGADAGDDRHVAARPADRSSSAGRAVATGVPTRPRSTMLGRPPLAIGAARRTGHRGVGAGQADRAGAGAAQAATNRVLIAPASTATTTSSVARVGDAQPVHLPLGDARGRQRRVDLRAAAVDDDQRRLPRRADAIAVVPRAAASARLLEQLAAELQDDPRARAAITAGPCARRGPSIDVQVLHGLAGGALHQVVEHRRPARAGRAGLVHLQPMSQKLVCATCLISGSAPPVSRTNGASAYAAASASVDLRSRSCPGASARRSSRGCRDRAAPGAARTSPARPAPARSRRCAGARTRRRPPRCRGSREKCVRSLGALPAPEMPDLASTMIGAVEQAGLGQRLERQQRGRRIAPGVRHEPRAPRMAAACRSVRP